MPSFSEEDLTLFDLSVAASPYRYSRCGHGHPVDLSGIPYSLVKKRIRGGWTYRVRCLAFPCDKCYDPVIMMTTGCKGFVELRIPDDPAHHLWAPYPRHQSTAWRDRAAVLPRTDGLYIRTVSSSKKFLEARRYNDRCLAFGPDGDLLDIETQHDGYDRPEFQQLAAGIAGHFSKGLRNWRSHPNSWRGLYEVNGTTLTASLTEVSAEKYGFTATLSSDATRLKLKKTNGKGHKAFKGEYVFHPVG